MARERLVALLAEEARRRVVGDRGVRVDAVDGDPALAPDLVFLDMQMPELDGFGVIEAIGADRMPPTIFVTAYDEYAVQAFEVHALDYLLKPFGRHASRRRWRGRGCSSNATGGTLASSLSRSSRSSGRRVRTRQRVMVRAGGRVAFVDVEQIDWVEAEGNYVRLHVGAESYLIRER